MVLSNPAAVLMNGPGKICPLPPSFLQQDRAWQRGKSSANLKTWELYQLSSLEQLEHEVHVVSETGTRGCLGHQWGASDQTELLELSLKVIRSHGGTLTKGGM